MSRPAGWWPGQRFAPGCGPHANSSSYAPDAVTLIDNWLRTPVERMREVRLELLIKIYVLARSDPVALNQLLRSQVDVCEAYQLRVAARAAALDGFARLVAESKASAAESTAGWLRRYAVEFRSSSQTAKRTSP